MIKITILYAQNPRSDKDINGDLYYLVASCSIGFYLIR